MKNFWRLITAWVIVSGLASGTVHAQSVDQIFSRFIKRYHTYQSITLPYYLFVPANYDPRTKYPLVLCLHGAGEKGDNPSAVKNNSMAIVWARDTNQTRWPCFILVPQCPINGSWVYLPGPGSYNSDVIPISPDLSAVNDLVDSLLVEYSVDQDRLYVTGLSMGGFATWDLIVRFPDKFAAAIPMSGAGDTSKAGLIKHIPIWDFHGAMDNVVPVTGSREMISALQRAGVPAVYTHCHNGDCTGLPDSVIADRIKSGRKLFYTQYQDGWHSIWDQAYNTAFLLPWTFSQSKTKVNVLAQGFDAFLARVNSAPVSLRPTVVDSFMAAVPSFPYTENDTTVCFIYRGVASSVTVPGFLNNWNSNAFPMTNISGTDFWYYSSSLASDARVEYQVVIDGSNWILDPRNPNTFGANSELKMPRYPETPEINYYPDTPHGSLHDTTFASSILANSRTVRVYTPPGYEQSSDSFAVILFHDGLDWVSLGQANSVIDYLISKYLIQPIVAVFVPPVNRDAEYWSSQQSQFASFISNELMPFIDARYRTRRDPKSRAVLGSSAGSVISLYLGYNYPHVFGNVGALSGANQDNKDSYENGPLQPLRIYADVGTYEVPYYSDMTSLRAILQMKRYTYQYNEWHDGHSWGNWRAHLDNALRFFFAIEPSSPVVTTGATSLLTSTSATLNGSVNPSGSQTAAWFEWGVDSAFSSFEITALQWVGSGGSAVSVSANLKRLRPGTSYYYHVVAGNDSGISQGMTRSFTTMPNHAPTVFGLLFPGNRDTVRLTYPTQSIKFSWLASSDPDGDTLQYSLTLKGPGIDTTIAQVRDTTIELNIMSRLERQSAYIWTATASDGLISVASADTFLFWTPSAVTGIENLADEVPEDYALRQNYPNPFNPSTMIRFSLPKSGHVTLKVYDVLGREVETLVEGERTAGDYSVEWTPNNLASGVSSKGGYASGVYFYRLQAGAFSDVKRLVLLK
jgi:predicted peptidase